MRVHTIFSHTCIVWLHTTAPTPFLGLCELFINMKGRPCRNWGWKTGILVFMVPMTWCGQDSYQQNRTLRWIPQTETTGRIYKFIRSHCFLFNRRSISIDRSERVFLVVFFDAETLSSKIQDRPNFVASSLCYQKLLLIKKKIAKDIERRYAPRIWPYPNVLAYDPTPVLGRVECEKSAV